MKHCHHDARLYENIAHIDQARSEALDELGRAVRHELATIAHITTSLRERCERGDIVVGLRRIDAANDRIDRLRELVDEYTRPSEHGGGVRLSTVRDTSVALLSARAVARGRLPVELEIAEDVAELPLALPRSAVSLAVLQLSEALLAAGNEAPATGGRDLVTLWRHEPSDSDLRVGIASPSARHTPSADWPVAWVRHVVQAHGGDLVGPELRDDVPVAGSVERAYAFLLRLPLADVPKDAAP